MPAAMTKPAAQSFADDTDRWAAVMARDPRADGVFFYSVRTTGVFCRPTCAARPALRRNVGFYDSAAAAIAAGFRPCKRCRPDGLSPSEDNRQKIQAACRMIESAEAPPALDDLARAVGLSPYHFHRLFKSTTGVTPHAYAKADRTNKVRKNLASAGTVTAAIYDAGFNSSGRFYETAPSILGMKPGDFRRGGAGAEIRYGISPCALGLVLVAVTDKGICSILLGDDAQTLERELRTIFSKASLISGDADLAQQLKQVARLIETPACGLDLPLDVRGTAFQQRVWQMLRRIPAGETRSYAQIAESLGMPRGARAVASACAANTLAVAVPCHRVVRGTGELSGYRWGIRRKQKLLDREAQVSGEKKDIT